MDLKEKILEKIEIKNEMALSTLLNKNLTLQRNLNSMTLEKPVVEFKIQHFLRGLDSIVSEMKKQDAMEAKMLIIQTLFENWDYSLSLPECFVIYQLRDLGKFRLKDDKFMQQLTPLWQSFPDYELDKTELKQSLKDLKNLKVLDYRKGTIIFVSSMILR